MKTKVPTPTDLPTTTPPLTLAPSLEQPSSPTAMPGSAGYTGGLEAASGASNAEEVLSPSAELVRPGSMAVSLTGHALNPPAEKFTFLLCGVDSLDLGLFVTWEANWKQVLASLDASKEQAVKTKGIVDITDIGREFLHLPSGKAPNYRYHLQFPEYHIFVAISEKFGTSPNVYVSINSEALWHVGLITLLNLIECDLANFGGTVTRVQPSRCDMSVDFRLNGPLTFPFVNLHRVSRSRKIRPVLTGDDLETYYCGSPSSPVQIRLYDKGKEIFVKDKQWFLNLWNTEDPNGVWRVEFQLRRPFLKQYRIQTIDDLADNLSSMWDYLTKEWFSLRLRDNEKAERRTLHPWWQAVLECRYLFGKSFGAKRNFSSDGIEPIQHTLAHIIGRMISISAQCGIRDRKEAIANLCELLERNTEDQKFDTEYRKRLIRLGYRGTLGGEEDDNYPF